MRRWTRTMAALGALALALTACGGGGEEEPAAGDTGDGAAATDGGGDGGGAADGDPIAIGAIFDESGATADVGTLYAEGVRAYVDWVNNNGGIDGRPIEMPNADYAYDVARAEQLYSQYTSENDLVAFSGWGTGDTEALVQRVAEDELPFISGSLSEELRNPEEAPYNFVVALTYSDQARVALNYINSTAEGPVEIAFFHHDSPFGTSPIADAQAYVEEQGYDMNIEAYPMPSGATSFSGELAQAEQQGADYIFIQNVASPAAQLARDVASSGMDAQVVCLVWCGDQLYIDLAGAEVAEGTLGVLPWAPPDQADGDLSDVEQWLSDNGRSLEDIDLHFTQGWYQFASLVEGIRVLVEEGTEVTGANLKTALEEMDAFDTPVSVPIDYSAEDHAGMKSGVVYQVTDGAWTPVSDPITP